MSTFKTPIEKLPQVGPRYVLYLNKLGIKTAGDLLFYFPFRYDDFSEHKKIKEVQAGQVVSIKGEILHIENTKTWRRRMTLTHALVQDETGAIQVVWFNQPFLTRSLQKGMSVSLSGKVGYAKEGLQLSNPAYEVLGRSGLHTGRLVPVYHETEGVSSKWLRAHIKPLIKLADAIPEFLPDEVLERQDLLNLSEAVKQIHFPDDVDAAEFARRRLAFDELFLVQLYMQRQRQKWQGQKAVRIRYDRKIEKEIKDFLDKLPFKLTDGQRVAVWKIIKDLEKDSPMNRLLEGDVGSGKTLVALLAVLVAVKSGYQALIMAPTEILARQHYLESLRRFGENANSNATLTPTLSLLGRGDNTNTKCNSTKTELQCTDVISPHPDPLLEGEGEMRNISLENKSSFQKDIYMTEDVSVGFPLERGGLEGRGASDLNIKIALLTGSESRFFDGGKEVQLGKNKIIEKIKNGEADLVIGTHALIQENVNFKKLALSVVDEQHRFGIEQRAKIQSEILDIEDGLKTVPHLLSMTATPIPRTLALTIYGDLDLSVLSEMPKGRQKIITKLVAPGNREKAYDFIRKQIRSGRQAFVICPLIEESDFMEVKSATQEYERLQKEVYPDFSIGLLHGKMKPKEKEEVMKKFSENRINILISTSVVEVGIDIPNATVMLIEGADRFGLAQLHQFRGRVGRGQFQSYCFLFTDSTSGKTHKRLKALIESGSGFELAQKDLELRGPGELIGVRQSGLPDLAMASLSDSELIEQTREEAKLIMENDPDLKKYPKLLKRIEGFEKDVHLE